MAANGWPPVGDNLVQVFTPVFRLVSGIDLLKGATGDFPSVDRIEPGAGEALTKPHGAVFPDHVDQADGGEKLLQMVGIKLCTGGESAFGAEGGPVGKDLLMTGAGCRWLSQFALHLH